MAPRERRATLRALACAMLLLPVAARATEPKPASPDSDLLEFLGSGDDEDTDLQQYLASPDAAGHGETTTPPKRSGNGRS